MTMLAEACLLSSARPMVELREVYLAVLPAGGPKEGSLAPQRTDFGEVQRYYSLDTNTVTNNC